jgi:arylsulfatase A-like enzyme
VRREEHERLVKEGKWDDAVQAYLAAITFADEMVGQILKAVDESDQAGNTIIVFWSDHGWHLGEKQHWHKSTLWERATHVPMIWHGPGIEHNGEDRAQQIELVDMYPTLAELCGLDASGVGLDGISLVPQLRDPAATKRPAVIDYMPGNYAVLTDKWRYIRYHDGSEELYDRVEDPNDWHNLAGLAEHEALKKELAEWMPKTSAPMAPHKDEYDFDPATYTYRLLSATSTGG